MDSNRFEKRLQPSRPSLGKLAWAALAAWGCVCAAEEVMWRKYAGSLDELLHPAVFVLGICLLAIVAACCFAKVDLGSLVRPLAVALLSGACVFASSVMFWSSWEQDVCWLQESLSQGQLEIELVGDPSKRDYGYVSEAQVTHGNRQVQLRVLWPEGESGIAAGHVVLVAGSMKAPSSDDAGRWNHQQGFAGIIKVSAYQENGFATGLRGVVTGLRDRSFERISSIGGDAAGLLAGILLGNKTLYSGTELEQDFKTTGLAHLMAVSGTHLAVVAMIFGWLLSRLRFGKGVRSALLALLLVAYVALTAFAPSAMRACVMCVVGLGSFALQRRRHVLSALSLCVVMFLALDPSLAFSLGYQLSVLCMVGLLVLSPLVSVWMRHLFCGRAESIAEGLAATLAANMATLPVTVPLFFQLPLISPLSTLVASPLITLALGLGIVALLACEVVEPAGLVLLRLAAAVGEACSCVVHGLADAPWGCVPLDGSAVWIGWVFAAAAVALWAVWPLPAKESELRNPASLFSTRRLGAAFVFVLPLGIVMVAELGGAAGCANIVGTVVESDAEVVMLDVGQGDSMLIRDGDAAVLVDTGEEGNVLLKDLARHGISHLDAVLLSHKDSDHTGALSSLTGVVDVSHVFIHRDLLGLEEEGDVLLAARWATQGRGAEGVGVGDTVDVGRFRLTLLAPQEGGASENDESLIWELDFDADGDGAAESKGLLVGDAEEEAIQGLCSQLGDIQFYKVAHHGSRGAITSDEMAVLKPEIALISVGADNEYGHPTQETLEVLQTGGSRVFRTDEQGDITLSFDGGRVGVRTQK